MPSRTFIDARGVEWMVWAVAPSWVERRTGRDRRGPTTLERAVFDHLHPERRTHSRRRGLSDSGPRVKISADLTGGWLAFEGGNQRRRLTPIPAGWEEMSDDELAALSRDAIEVTVRRGRLIE
jgi:hypothetical protein